MKASLLVLTGCTTAISIQSNVPNTTIYVSDMLPSTANPPAVYAATGSAPLVCEIEYFAWETYYIWADAPGYQTLVIPISGEIKIGPALGTLFCFWPAVIWAYGPSEGPIYINLSPETAMQLDGPMPVYTQDGIYAGQCEWMPEADGTL